MSAMIDTILDIQSTTPVDYSERAKAMCRSGNTGIVLVGDLPHLCGTINGRIMVNWADDGFGNAHKVPKGVFLHSYHVLDSH